MPHKAIIREMDGVVIDVDELSNEAAFWGGLLGQEQGQPRSGGGWLTVGTLEGSSWLVLQQVPESKTVKNRVHLDFRVNDIDEAIARIVELGGSQISEPRVGGGVTMADPEGNEFCIGAYRRNKEGTRIPL